jgi:hypothetical protein
MTSYVIHLHHGITNTKIQKIRLKIEVPTSNWNSNVRWTWEGQSRHQEVYGNEPGSGPELKRLWKIWKQKSQCKGVRVRPRLSPPAHSLPTWDHQYENSKNLIDYWGPSINLKLKYTMDTRGASLGTSRYQEVYGSEPSSGPELKKIREIWKQMGQCKLFHSILLWI